MSQSIRFLGILGSAALIWAGCSQAEGALEQYAWSASLSPSQQALQQLEIPLEILLEVTRSDLGDVAVFDSRGKAVPAWLRRQPAAQTELQTDLKFYQFQQAEQSLPKTVTTREQSQQGGQLSERTTTEVIDVRQSRGVYIIELPDQEPHTELISINLQWLHQPADQMLRVKLEVGSQLDQWHELQASKTFSSQVGGDDSWRSISDIPRGQKYLRITPLASVQSFQLLQASALYVRTLEPKLLTHSITMLRGSGDSKDYLSFEVPSSVQAQALRIIPGEPQSLISGELYASHEGFDQKRLVVARLRQHNYSDSELKPSPLIKLPQQAYKNWWLKPTEVPANAPRAELSWPVYELFFLANDKGPFRLSWGNYESTAPANRLKDMLEGDQQYETVQILKHEELGGKSRLSPQLPIPWLKWLLWTLLILAVLATARMAYSLFQEMQRER